jgi:hypothetical protein
MRYFLAVFAIVGGVALAVLITCISGLTGLWVLPHSVLCGMLGGNIAARLVLNE